ncbi:hypothetical protein C8R31_101309 [Nitrosospira sp. Nsp2]|nr:hypothetical protein C8R31_101309 [Nitrosospira sp. Nsp2]
MRMHSLGREHDKADRRAKPRPFGLRKNPARKALQPLSFALNQETQLPPAQDVGRLVISPFCQQRVSAKDLSRGSLTTAPQISRNSVTLQDSCT